MNLRPLLAVASLAAVAACPSGPSTPLPAPAPAAPSPPPGQPAPPTATGGEIVRLGPSALRYVAHQRIHIEQEFQGMSQPLDFGFRIFVAVTITGPADTVGYATTFSIDSVVADSGTTAPMGVNLGAAKGLAYAGRLTPAGEFRHPVPSDSAAAQALSPVVGAFRNFFPRLPAAGLTLGAVWTDTVSSGDRAAGEVVVTTVNRSTAAAWEERAGARCLRLDVTSNFTIQGAGEQGGQPFEVVGSGVRSGVDYVAVDGRYLGGESHDSTTMAITLPMQGMTIPRRQVSRSTVTVRP